MDFTIESYIQFCDGYNIADEGLKNIGKNIFITIKNVIEKIITFFRNLLYNINYFKNAKLPQQMSNDLELLIQNLQPRRNVTNKMVQFATVVIKWKQKTNDNAMVKIDLDEEMREMISEAEMSVDDANSTLSDVIESKEYKRVMENDYDFSKLSDIPLGQVVSKIKESQSNVTKYKGLIEKTEVKSSNGDIDKFDSLMYKLYQALLKIYQEQVKLLNIYFKHAKASLKGTASNVKDRLSKDKRFDRNYGSSKDLIKMQLCTKSKKLKGKDIETFRKLDNMIIDSDNKLENFDKYNSARKAMCRLLGAPENSVIIYWKCDNNVVQYAIVKDDSKPFKLLDNMRLFHSSKDDGLRELSPRYFFNQHGTRRLWKHPRVYMAIANGIGREGGKFDGFDRSFGTSSYLYTPTINIPTVYRDPEMFNGVGVYVETLKSIPVKKVK